MDGFNTFEKQDKILLGLNSGSDAAAALRILQQQGFAVQTFYRGECSFCRRAFAAADRQGCRAGLCVYRHRALCPHRGRL